MTRTILAVCVALVGVILAIATVPKYSWIPAIAAGPLVVWIARQPKRMQGPPDECDAAQR